MAMDFSFLRLNVNFAKCLAILYHYNDFFCEYENIHRLGAEYIPHWKQPLCRLFVPNMTTGLLRIAYRNKIEITITILVETPRILIIAKLSIRNHNNHRDNHANNSHEDPDTWCSRNSSFDFDFPYLTLKGLLERKTIQIDLTRWFYGHFHWPPQVEDKWHA